MHRARRRPWAAIAASALLLLTACGDDDDADTATEDETDTTEAADGDTEETTGDDGEGSEEEAAGFEVDASACPDDSVNEPIEGTVRIGTALPLSGGAAAAAFAPVAEGMRAYIDYANQNELLAGYELELFIEDDQYNPNLTTPAVEGLIDNDEVHFFSGIIGTPNNQAVRDLLNEECYPQLYANTGSPLWGDIENYPWTTGALAPYNTETAIYVADISRTFPDGTTAAVFHVNSEFGDAYQEAFAELAPDAGIEIVAEQTIEAADSNPPTAQVGAIASEQPEVVLAVPLGAQCPTFLGEIANAKAANPGWEPRVYITSTCASPLLLGLAGQAADEIITITSVKDANDPANFEDPAVAEYRDAMIAYGFPENGDFYTAAAGWTAMELTVETLMRAAESEDGLTRASILEAARVQDYAYLLARDGVRFRMDGAEDPFGVEVLQVWQYDAETRTYTDIGELITEFEGETELPD